MAAKQAIRMALWTELREAIKLDFPDLNVPLRAPKELEKVVASNADYMHELTNK